MEPFVRNFPFCVFYLRITDFPVENYIYVGFSSYKASEFILLVFLTLILYM